MSHLYTLIKSNLIKQTRRYQFFLTIGISIFLGFLCVPGKRAGYEIFYMGGVRGIYNSAWLGAMSAILPMILLWIPGFYMLRSQITEDGELKIGQMIAASPVSKERYIFGKFAANFSVLLVLQLIFLAAIMVMQLFHGESVSISVRDYILPLLLVGIPYLLVLAALTVLFDVVPFLKGSFGNIVIFMLWIGLLTVSIISPGNSFDLFGMGMLLNAMIEGARGSFPNLPDAASFGYYKTAADTPTFVWDGMEWGRGFLSSRLIWVIGALLIVEISAIIFNRFKEKNHIKDRKAKQITAPKSLPKRRATAIPQLSGVRRSNGVNLPRMIWGELKIMLAGHAKRWYLSALVVMALPPLVTGENSLRWISLILLLPMSIWAQMGNREKAYGTSELILSSCPALAKWVACWISGLIVGVLLSLGMFARVIILGEWSHLMPWVVGIVFVPTLALVLGGVSSSRRLFEGIFITLMYFGPINGLGVFDFTGLSSNNAAFYTAATAILFGIGVAAQLLIEKRLIGARR